MVAVCPESPHAEHVRDCDVKGAQRRFFKQSAPAGLRITTPPPLDADAGLFIAKLVGFGQVRKLEGEARSWQ